MCFAGVPSTVTICDRGIFGVASAELVMPRPASVRRKK
jgi:hypothetical protein